MSRIGRISTDLAQSRPTIGCVVCYIGRFRAAFGEIGASPAEIRPPRAAGFSFAPDEQRSVRSLAPKLPWWAQPWCGQNAQDRCRLRQPGLPSKRQWCLLWNGATCKVPFCLGSQRVRAPAKSAGRQAGQQLWRLLFSQRRQISELRKRSQTLGAFEDFVRTANGRGGRGRVNWQVGLPS